MKKPIIYSIFALFIFLTSCCSWAGDDYKKDASILYNYSGLLTTKIPSDFDDKFGYEVLVYVYSNDSSTITGHEVYVSKNTWERLPEPNDTTIVKIEYVENIEYGKNWFSSVLWDSQFNLCVGFTVDKTKK